MDFKAMVKEFQCSGCVNGGDPNECAQYKPSDREMRCVGHCLGTRINFLLFALGLPKGFNRPGFAEDSDDENAPPEFIHKMKIRLHPIGDDATAKPPEWNRLNVPVWAMEHDGFLFVRTFAPRINCAWVDVIEGGTLALCPNAINVAEFVDEID